MSAPLHLVALVRAVKDPVDRISLAELLAEQAFPSGPLPDRVDFADALLTAAAPSDVSALAQAMAWLDVADRLNPETTGSDGRLHSHAVAQASRYLDEAQCQYGMKAAA